jgi:hypothetical protein
LRDLLLTASGVDSSLIGIVPTDDINETLRGFLGKRGLILVMDEIGKAITNMTLGADARIHLEIGVIKAIGQLKKLEKVIQSRS